MNTKKKDSEVEKVEVGAPVEFSTTVSAKVVEPVEVAPVKVSVDLVNIEKYKAKIAELEAVLEKIVAKNFELETELKKDKVAQLTSEQKSALEHCFKWLKVFVSKSGAVEFRRDTKEAIATLSTLL